MHSGEYLAAIWTSPTEGEKPFRRLQPNNTDFRYCCMLVASDVA